MAQKAPIKPKRPVLGNFCSSPVVVRSTFDIGISQRGSTERCRLIFFGRFVLVLLAFFSCSFFPFCSFFRSLAFVPFLSVFPVIFLQFFSFPSFFPLSFSESNGETPFARPLLQNPDDHGRPIWGAISNKSSASGCHHHLP